MSKKIINNKGVSQNGESTDIADDPTINSAHPTGIPNAFQNRGWATGFRKAPPGSEFGKKTRILYYILILLFLAWMINVVI